MIHDLSTQKGRNEYMKALETQNSTKNSKTENIYLNRLKEQYKQTQSFKHRKVVFRNRTMCYNAMRLFCLDTQLLDFNTIEVMESEVNQSFY